MKIAEDVKAEWISKVLACTCKLVSHSPEIGKDID